MKYSATIWICALLWGVCSAKTLGPRPEDFRETKPHKAEDKNKQQQVQPKVKPRNTHLQLISPGNYHIPFDHLPNLADPVYVGSAVDHYSLMKMSYDDVEFEGLHTAHHPVLNVNLHSQVAILTLNLEKAELQGYFISSDLTRNTSGKFNVKMSRNLTYVSTYHYRVQDGNNIQVLHSSGQLHYQSSVSHYDIIVSYSPSIQKAVQTVLLQTVNEKVNHELLTKLNDLIRQHIQEIYPNIPNQYDSVETIMRASINSTINGLLQVLTKNGVSSIDLTRNDKDIVYNKLNAKIISVRLNGIDKFYLANKQVFYETPDKIHAQVQLAIDRPTVTTTVSIQEAHNEDAPFQKINVDFEIEELMAELSLDHSTRQSGLELRSVQTKVNRIRPLGTGKFEIQISNLIKEKLTSHMKPYIEEGLQNFIQIKFFAIIAQGALPPTQVKRSTHNHM